MIRDPVFNKDFAAFLKGNYASFLSEGGVTEPTFNFLQSFLSPKNKISFSKLESIGMSAIAKNSENWATHLTKRAEFFSGLSMQSFGSSVLDEAEKFGGVFTDEGWASQFAHKMTGSSRLGERSRNVKGFDKFNYSVSMLERTEDFISGAGGNVRPELGPEYANRFFGQSKVLRELSGNTAGGIIPAGAKNIMGAVTRENAAALRLAGASPDAALEMLRSELIGKSSGLGDVVQSTGAGEFFKNMGGGSLLETADQFSGKKYLSSLTAEQAASVNNMLRNAQAAAKEIPGAEILTSHKVSGYNKVRNLVEQSNVGDIFQLESGKRGIIGSLESAGDVSVLTASREAKTLAGYETSFAESVGSKSMTEQFRVKLEREPWTGERPDPWAVKVRDTGGRELGYIDRNFSQQFERHVKSGDLSGEWFGRVHKFTNKETQQLEYTVAVSRGAFRGNAHYLATDLPQRLSGVKAGSEGTRQSLLEGLFTEQGGITAESPIGAAEATAQAAAGSGQETVRKTGRAARAAKDTVESSAATMGNAAKPNTFMARAKTATDDLMANKTFKKYGAKAAMVAGALLLWGASRSSNRNNALTPEDVPRGLYGAAAGQPSERAFSQPRSSKIVQNNSGYSTNVEVSSTDANEVGDYRPLVNTLSSMASSSMGIHSRSSLHVVDDSSRMDSESIRRSVNAGLG